MATSRGQVYKASGRVGELDWVAEASVLYASVQGTDAEPYTVRITIAPHRFDGECSCPVRYNCKHVAASCSPGSSARRPRPPRTTRPCARSTAGCSAWSSRPKERARHEHHEPGEPLLFYQLDNAPLTQQRHGITLQVLQSRLLKRGGYGKETPYRYNGTITTPTGAAERPGHPRARRGPPERADLPHPDHRGRHRSPPDGQARRDGARVLGQRSRAGDPARPGPPPRLRLGAERRRRARAPHHARRGPGLAARADRPALYVDVATAACGILEEAPAAPLLAQLIEAPPLPEAHAQAVSNYLASRLSDAALPLPTPPNFVHVEEAPTPVLVLQSRDESPDIRDFFASIRFRYADYVLPFGRHRGRRHARGQDRDGKPLVLKRDLVAEMRHVVDFGKRHPAFESALSSDPGYFSRADRRPRTRDVQDIAHAWRHLLDARGELEAAGWSVQVREPFDLSFQSVTRVEATLSETASNWFDMALKLTHGTQTFDLLPLVIDWLRGESKGDAILLQADDGQWLEIAPELFEPVARTLLELYDDPASAAEGERLRLPRQRAGTLDELDASWERQGISVAWHDAGDVFSLAERLPRLRGARTPRPATGGERHAPPLPARRPGLAGLSRRVRLQRHPRRRHGPRQDAAGARPPAVRARPRATDQAHADRRPDEPARQLAARGGPLHARPSHPRLARHRPKIPPPRSRAGRHRRHQLRAGHPRRDAARRARVRLRDPSTRRRRSRTPPPRSPRR